MDWFTQLFGFAEDDYARTQARLRLEADGRLHIATEPPRDFIAGALELPSLQALRERVAALPVRPDARPQWRAIVADAASLHLWPQAQGSVIQVASQFNLLEMPSPGVTPEAGITAYAHDHTQGPACAMACAAGTLARNYLVPFPDGLGQTADRQLNTLQEVLSALEAQGLRGTFMRNGYLMASTPAMQAIAGHLRGLEEAQRDALRQRLRIGVQHRTQVTLPGAPSGQVLTQAYCAALPIAYNRGTLADWEPLARLVLEATYEATLLTALLNARQTGNPRVYLTLVGGGVFGNPPGWILQAIERALHHLQGHALEVIQVCYRQVAPEVAQAIQGFAEGHDR